MCGDFCRDVNNKISCSEYIDTFHIGDIEQSGKNNIFQFIRLLSGFQAKHRVWMGQIVFNGSIFTIFLGF